MDYTIRNVSDELDAAIRERVATEQKSVNEVLLDALRRGIAILSQVESQRDLSNILGGTPLEPEVIQALEDQRKIDLEGSNWPVRLRQ